MGRHVLNLIALLAGVALVTVATYKIIPVNAVTAGFAYLLLVLVVATTWGFLEAAVASLLATLAFNFYFLPPVGTLTIVDPQNWVALFSFLATALIASRLSDKAKRTALDAIESERSVERLYTFSRSILLIESSEPFEKQLSQKIAEIFEVNAVVLYDRRTGEIYRAGPSDCEGIDDQLRDAALQGTSFWDAQKSQAITAVRLGSEPIASLALQGAKMPDSVLQGIANLVAIGLERSKAQDLEHQVQAARQTEELRTTLIDAMAHEFKTPLTSIKAATSSLLSNPDQPIESRKELLSIADEEAGHLQILIDDSIEMARLDTGRIDIHLELSDLSQLSREVIASMKNEIEDRPLDFSCQDPLPAIALDRRWTKLAIKQLVDNALKYSPPRSAVTIRVFNAEGANAFEITDRGKGIPNAEQPRIFERFYRSSSVRQQVPGSGLGLSIARSIARVQHGDLTVISHPGETTFRLTLPVARGDEG